MKPQSSIYNPYLHLIIGAKSTRCFPSPLWTEYITLFMSVSTTTTPHLLFETQNQSISSPRSCKTARHQTLHNSNTTYFTAPEPHKNHPPPKQSTNSFPIMKNNCCTSHAHVGHHLVRKEVGHQTICRKNWQHSPAPPNHTPLTCGTCLTMRRIRFMKEDRPCVLNAIFTRLVLTWERRSKKSSHANQLSRTLK